MKQIKIRGIVLLTPLIIGIILFLVYTSQNAQWGGSYWENWLTVHAHLNQALARELVFWARKTLHFFGYGCLGLLLWFYCHLWGLKNTLRLGILFTLLIAMLDEYTQSLTGFRSGRLGDVLLDFSGAVIITGLFNYYIKHESGK